MRTAFIIEDPKIAHPQDWAAYDIVACVTDHYQNKQTISMLQCASDTGARFASLNSFVCGHGLYNCFESGTAIESIVLALKAGCKVYGFQNKCDFLEFAVATYQYKKVEILGA